ncbi:Fic family protein [Luteibacter yeojuensis]|uniref:Fido domain-containing protein n=1 Tax=Luteibacter yeojuensis TaxID=345309 RepID=A0A7X5QRW0_9GAMM|nr:Fic family protein [Luteibacter yeojuensis]NID14220.1 hypothetical protein [Luteibacter yeojuensis]
MEAMIHSNEELTRLNPSNADAAGFIGILERVNTGVSQGLASRRTNQVFTEGKDGSRILFPPVGSIDENLYELWNWLETSKSPAFCKAAVGYCCVSNLHPFTDGNGRTARWLWASILRREKLCTAPFFPLYEFFARSRGSSVIYLRLAELRGNWDSLVNFLARIVILMGERQTLSRDRMAQLPGVER